MASLTQVRPLCGSAVGLHTRSSVRLGLAWCIFLENRLSLEMKWDGVEGEGC